MNIKHFWKALKAAHKQSLASVDPLAGLSLRQRADLPNWREPKPTCDDKTCCRAARELRPGFDRGAS